MSEPNVEQVVSAYLKLRTQKEAVENAAKQEVQAIKEKMAKLESWILSKANEQSVTSFKTKSGTAFVTTTDFANVADWDAVLGFIKQNDAFDMLERRVSKVAVRGYIESKGSVPAGVNYGTKIEINVRKPTARADD